MCHTIHTNNKWNILMLDLNYYSWSKVVEGVNPIKGITIWWTCERDQMSMIEFLKYIMLTHGTKYFVMWRNNLPRVHGWTIKTDKRMKWMKNENRWTKKKWRKLVYSQELCVNPNSTYSQLKGMCWLKHHLFISKRYVLIETSILHLQEIYVNQNTTSSSPRGMFPLGIETIWSYTLFIPFLICFLFEFILSDLLCLGPFLMLE